MFLSRLKLPLILVTLLLLCVPLCGVHAEEGEDITSLCRVRVPGTLQNWGKAIDGNYNTLWGRGDSKPYNITIDLPEGTDEGGLYLCFSIEPQTIGLFEEDEEKPFFVQEGPGFAHRYIPFEGEESLRLVLKGQKDRGFALSEFFVLAGAEPPSWVQRWEPQFERADLLVLVAHPDDELIWMGGALPYYTKERKLDVAVAYLTCSNPLRRSELLNGLWTAGIRHYPYIGEFRDRRLSRIKDIYQMWGGREKVEEHIVSLYRRLKPRVVLSHDLQGEYGHPAHVICARNAVTAFDIAADSKIYPESAELYGVWNVSKLYLHLYAENQIEMDWEQPLDSLGGVTPLEITRDAFNQHRSQRSKISVEVKGPHSAARFGLVSSLVGDDERKNDFFENIP